MKIQKLSGENQSLAEEMASAREHLRLSAGQIQKLNNELKITCNQLEEVKKRLDDSTQINKRVPEL